MKVILLILSMLVMVISSTAQVNFPQRALQGKKCFKGCMAKKKAIFKARRKYFSAKRKRKAKK